MAQSLSDQRRIIIPDLLGFGRSPWPRGEYTVDDHLKAIEALLEDLGLDASSLDVAGHSMGAILALELAARRRETVGTVALVGLPYFSTTEEARAHVAQYGWLSRLTMGDYRGAKVLCDIMCLLRPVLLPVAPLLAPSLPPDVVRDALRHNFASFSRSMQNVVVPVSNIHQLLQGLPGWRLEAVPDVGHYLPMQEPEIVAKLLESTLIRS